MAKSSALEILYGLGYEPVDIESDADYIRALKESYNKLQIENPSDPRLIELVDAVKGFRQAKSKKEAAKSGGKSRPAKRRKGESFSDVKAKIDAKEKKSNAMNFISPGSALAPVTPAGDDGGGGDMSGVLMKISNDVNIIKGIVAAENKIEEDKADDVREAREKKKRGMREKLLEGAKGGFKKVKGVVGKLLKPLEGVFSQIFKFLSLFLLGTGIMKLLDWMGNSGNQKKLQSMFRFLKDYWPAIVTALMAFIPGFPVLGGVIALAVGFLPKLITLIKSLLGFGKEVDKTLKDGEKDLTNLDENAQISTEATDLEQSNVKDDANATVEKPKTTGEKPPAKLNRGGAVPGSGDTDTVPAMLTPGEFVLTKDAVNQYGLDSLYAMNAAAGGASKPSEQPPARKMKPKTSTVGTMMNMGGFINNFAMDDYHQTFGNVYMNRGGEVQHMFIGGMVKKAGNIISKSPQARLLKFAVNQVKKLPVKPPIAKALKALKNLAEGSTTPAGAPSSGSTKEGYEIPSFSVKAPGGRAKELTLGIRR